MYCEISSVEVCNCCNWLQKTHLFEATTSTMEPGVSQYTNTSSWCWLVLRETLAISNRFFGIINPGLDLNVCHESEQARSWLGRESDVEPTSTRTACKTRKFVARVLLQFFFYIFRVISKWCLLSPGDYTDRTRPGTTLSISDTPRIPDWIRVCWHVSVDFTFRFSDLAEKPFPCLHFQTIGQVARLRRDLQMNAGLTLFFWTIQTRLESFGSALISTLLPCEWNHCDLTYSNSWNRSEAARTPPRNQHRGQHSKSPFHFKATRKYTDTK